MPRGVRVLLAVVMAIGLAGGLPWGGRSTRADDTRSAHAWVELHAARPAVGCTVDLGIEVRADDGGIADLGVSVALNVDGDTIATDSATTDESGVAYVGIDTGSSHPGADGWIDVHIADAYIGGLALQPTDDGSCDGDGSSFDTAVDVPAWAAGGRGGEGAGGGTFIAVPTHGQERNLSCEYAALQIATSAFGDGVPESWFVDVVGQSENPHWGFRGDIDGWWGNTDDYGVYADALAPALEEFGFYGDAFYGWGDPDALTARLDAGMPTLVWIGLWGDTSFDAYAEDGTRFRLATGEHVVVAYGYDDSGVYVSDPAIGDTDFYSWDEFMSMWEVLNGMGLAVAPA